MTKEEFNLQWNYYLSIESDLSKVSRYIEPCQENFKTYSVEFVKILLAACSGLDLLFRETCNKLDDSFKTTTKRQVNIKKYASIILTNQPKIVEAEIYCRDLKLRPFEDWKYNGTKDGGKRHNGNAPKWWTAHNNIKHREDKGYKNATFENALNVVAALLVMNLVVKELFNFSVTPPEYLSCEYMPIYSLENAKKSIL